MAANFNPIAVLTPNTGQCLLATANLNYDGTGTIVTGFTAGSNGSRVPRVKAFATGSTVAGLVNIFVKQGSTYTPLGSIVVGAVASPSATVPPWSGSWTPEVEPLILKTGATLVFTTTISQGIAIAVPGGDF